MPKVNKTVDERMTQADKDSVAKMISNGYFNTKAGRSSLFPILWKPYVYDKEKIKLISTSINDSFLLIGKHIGKSFKTSLLQDKLNERLVLLNIPALIIQGDYDPLPLSSAEINHQVLKGSKLVVLNNCGHFPFIEKQEEFTKIVDDFLQSLSQKID